MLELTWYGNATLRIRSKDTTLVLDPFLSRNPALPRFDSTVLSGIDGILVTHGHFDHTADLPWLVRRAGGVPVHAAEDLARHLTTSRDLARHDVQAVTLGEPLAVGDMTLTALRARHVHLDLRLKLSTLLRMACPTRWNTLRQAPSLLREHARCPEVSCTAWVIDDGDQTLVHLGSLGLDSEGRYPERPDILALPLQGNTHIVDLGVQVVARLRPRTVVVHHIDDAFPPLSRTIDPGPFVHRVTTRWADTRVIVPCHGVPFVCG